MVSPYATDKADRALVILLSYLEDSVSILPYQKSFYGQTYESEYIADHLRWQIGEGSRRHG